MFTLVDHMKIGKEEFFLNLLRPALAILWHIEKYGKVLVLVRVVKHLFLLSGPKQAKMHWFNLKLGKS